MSKKSDEIAARRAALGLTVVTNSNYPGDITRPPSMQDQMTGSGFSRRRRISEPGPAMAKSGVPSENDYYVPREEVPAAPTIVPPNDVEPLPTRVATFVTWLEEQYHANLAPFAFLSENAINVDELPEDLVVQEACRILRNRGWQISIRHGSGAGCRTASIAMMAPENCGF